MKEEQKKSLAAFRNEVYGFLKAEGFDMTGGDGTRHSRLKKILKSVYEHRQVELSPEKPLEHRFTCPQCLGVKVRSGKSGKRWLQVVRKANKLPTPPTEETH